MNEVDLLGWLPGWTRVLLDTRVTSFIVMLATGFNVWVSHRMKVANEKSAEAAAKATGLAERSAKLAEDALDISRKTMEIGNRPYIAITSARLPITNEDGDLVLPVRFRLYGRVPVRITAASFKAQRSLDDDDFVSTPTIETFVIPSELEAGMHCPCDDPALLAEVHRMGGVACTVVINYTPVGMEGAYLTRGHMFVTSSGIERSDFYMR